MQHYNIKYHSTMVWVAAFAIHLTLKLKKEMTIEQHCLLFSDSEHPDDNTQSIPSAHLPS